MLKKTIFIGIVTLSTLFIPTATYTAQYYDQYPGNCFVPNDESFNYTKSHSDGYLFHNDATSNFYYCPVNFNVPDGSTYFIKSIGMRFIDNEDNGYLRIILYRHNLYTGVSHSVADWNSGEASEFPGEMTASQGTIAGRKLVDTKKFAYFLSVQFYDAGGIPGASLMLYQVRIHYGT